MQAPTAPRVQLVISGKFITLFLAALALLGCGYYWYARQEQSREFFTQRQERFKAPPYFVNRGASVIRSCQRCLGTGQLQPQPEWKTGPAKEIPATEQRWFLAVEDPPVPATVAGVLMMPVYPALRDDPSFGFDQTRVMLVLYQNLERKRWIEQAGQPPPPVPADPPKPSSFTPESAAAAASAVPESLPRPAEPVVPLQSPYVGDWKNVDPNTKSLTRLSITSNDYELAVHVWAKCQPVECDWGVGQKVPLSPSPDDFLIIWDHGYALHSQSFSLEGNSRLKVVLKTHFTDKSGRHDREIISFFTKAAATP